MAANQTASQNDLFYPMPTERAGLMGLPHLMEMAFRGLSLEPPAQALIQRANQNPQDANALMDLASIMYLKGEAPLARRIQDDALSISRHYTLPAVGPERLRVLSIMAPGTLMDNAPIEFLLHGSQIALDMVYVEPGTDTLRLDLPPHDVACIGVCESDEARLLLETLHRLLPRFPRPTINDPARIMAVARDTAWRLLYDAPSCAMPSSSQVDRATLVELGEGHAAIQALLPGGDFPIICRPRGSHAGKGLARIHDAAELKQYLATEAGDAFYVSCFVDYISADQQYRKYRIAFVGGKPYPVHMALSARWMVHYLNGDMHDRPDNRAAEQHFMDAFERDFGRRHAAALAAIDERVGLDYFSIDCGEMPDGRLLVFEIDSGGVAHAMDPLDDFGYKRPHMLRLFSAFQTLLTKAAQDPACLKPKSTQA
jgi:hypothetical protein